MSSRSATFGLVIAAALSVLPKAQTFADVFSYECDSFPTEAGWELAQQPCDPKTWLQDGWYYQYVHHETCDPPAGGQDAYVRSLDDFIGEDRFFVEWRVETDGDRSEIPGGAPTGLSAWSRGPVMYWFAIARDQVKFIQDNFKVVLFVDIEPGPHTYRLEAYGDQSFVWFIDGEIIYSGIPGGPYPSVYPHITWRARAWYLDSTVWWDYIRYGTIPEPGSGDFDSDGDVDLRDFYFFDECLANGGPDVEAGPGCLWADMDQDDDVDFHDFALFQLAFTGGG